MIAGYSLMANEGSTPQNSIIKFHFLSYIAIEETSYDVIA